MWDCRRYQRPAFLDSGLVKTDKCHRVQVGAAASLSSHAEADYDGDAVLAVIAVSLGSAVLFKVSIL